MRLQRQTTFGGPAAPVPERGNCGSTCIACILGLDTSEVPNFCGAEDADDSGNWFTAAQRWLAPRGLALAEFNTNPGTWGEQYAPIVSIASGPGPRGHSHSVLWQHGKLLHDPHPSGDGLIEATSWCILIVVDLDLARLATERRLGRCPRCDRPLAGWQRDADDCSCAGMPGAGAG